LFAGVSHCSEPPAEIAIMRVAMTSNATPSHMNRMCLLEKAFARKAPQIATL
jgi:hypothetical protein